MNSFKGCDCLTDSYFDPPVVGEIDHLYWDQRSPYPPDVYTNLVLIMKHKYYDEIKEKKQLKV
ncbi:unnamed protein product [Sphenostylis stenocarpa]|uniref:Uncharacterized protein n=1 Tax=Sphenostylis stenocarpa TaxID=92480 RepID=A0AA86VGL0_9FABA|nr:unnamed protein product [Sphenostylis stenocarpa]